MLTLASAAPAVTAAFLASLVEVVEAFTIVLAPFAFRADQVARSPTFRGVLVLSSRCDLRSAAVTDLGSHRNCMATLWRLQYRLQRVIS